MTIEAMKQALDALIVAEAGLADIGDADREPGDDLKWCENRAAQALPSTRSAITAIRYAIEQAQKPVAWVGPSWLHPETRGWANDSFESIPIAGWIPLYTAPRQWQGLMKDESGSCIACGNRMTGSSESFVVATAEVGVTAPEGCVPQQVGALHPHKGGDKTAPPLAEPVQEQGLTKDEVDGWELPDRPTVFEFAKFVEAKLKAKNT